MFEWPGFRHIDDADDNEEKRVGTFRKHFVNFSPHNKMMRSISKNARQCLGRSRSSLFLWMSVTVFWRTDEWDSLSPQGNIEMNQHRQCLLTMIKNSSGVIMVWQIVCDQNHSFQTPIKVLKICEGHFRTQNVWNKIFNIFWFIIGTVCNLKIDQSSHNSHQKMSEILMFSPCKILIHCLCNRHSEATHIS